MNMRSCSPAETPPFVDFPALIEAVGRRGTPALTVYRGRAARERLTHSELARRVETAAALLAGTYGLRRGDRVAVLAQNGIELPILFLALLRSGAVLVPLNPTAPPDDWAYIVRHAEVRGLFVAQELRELAAMQLPAGVFVAGLDALARPFATVPAAPVDADEPAIILYTSGTTGRPKGVALSQRNLIANAWSMAQRFRLRRATQMAVLPLYHAHALGFGLMTALLGGGHLVLAERFDPLAWAQVARAESVTVTSVVPTLLPLLRQARVTRVQMPALEHVLVSSAPLPVEWARDFERESGIRLIHGWGLSEYTNFACCIDPWAGEPLRRRLLLESETPSVGAPLPGVEIDVLDEQGRSVGEGQRGELCLRGPSRMSGYHAQPEATAEAVRGGWLHTGDEGYYCVIDGQARFFVSGRIKELIIRGGEKYSPVAIERRIVAALPELEGRIAVVGFAHAAWGEEVGAYVETAAPPPSLAAAVATLPVEQRPKVIVARDRPIPRTHTGKVQRNKLRDLFRDHCEHRGPLRIVSDTD
jgi:long-chain acyl-CoA synthetase